MNNSLHVEIVTPYDMFFEGEVDQIILPALDGYIGILPGHSPIIIALLPGVAEIIIDEVKHYVAIADGFAQIELDTVIVVVGSAERPDQINRERAEKSLYRAQQRLKDKSTPPQEIERSHRSVGRAKARIKVYDKNANEKPKS